MANNNKAQNWTYLLLMHKQEVASKIENYIKARPVRKVIYYC